MENSFQTSFIPKKPIATERVVAKPATSLFTVITIIILIVMGLAAGGLYLYKNYLIGQKAAASKSLELARNDFEKDTIDNLELFDKRVSASKQVLANHIVLSPLFQLLGDLTIPSIQYTKFDHQTTDKGFSVKMSGLARDYKAIALQSESFNSAKGRYFKNVVFSNLTLSDAKDKKGYVGFDIEFTVDPILLSYDKNNLLEQAQAKIDTTNSANQSVNPQSTPATGQTPPVIQVPTNTPPTNAPASNQGSPAGGGGLANPNKTQ